MNALHRNKIFQVWPYEGSPSTLGTYLGTETLHSSTKLVLVYKGKSYGRLD